MAIGANVGEKDSSATRTTIPTTHDDLYYGQIHGAMASNGALALSTTRTLAAQQNRPADSTQSGRQSKATTELHTLTVLS